MIRFDRISTGQLKPQFLVDLCEVLNPLPDVWVITQGFRSASEQERLWNIHKNGGPLAAPPGKSAHEYGLAVDVVLDDDKTTVKLEANWDPNDPRWLALFSAIWKHPRLHSGRDFGDACHIEQLGWKANVNK